MKAATHYGECQLCGRQQKNPAGALAKHGYTVKWSMFLGTCPGSHCAPYEISCDEIKRRIPEVEKNLIECAAAVETSVSNPMKADKILVRLYFSQGHGGDYRIVETQLREIAGRGYNALEVLHPGSPNARKEADRVEHWTKYETYFEGLAETVAKLNRQHVQRLEDERANVANYLTWLKERAAAWVLKELKPVGQEAPKLITGLYFQYTNPEKTQARVYKSAGGAYSGRTETILKGTPEECRAHIAAIDAQNKAIREERKAAAAAECKGHESTKGPIGNTVYCDGTCKA